MVSSWGDLRALGSLGSAPVPAQQCRQVLQVSTLSLIEPYILRLAFAIDTALKCLSNTVSAPNVKKDASVVFFFFFLAWYKQGWSAAFWSWFKVPVRRHWERLGNGVVSLLGGKPLLIVLKKNQNMIFFSN